MTARQAMKIGIQGYLVKPFDLKQLEEAMGVPDIQDLIQPIKKGEQKGRKENGSSDVS